jgi:hypothetical protein
MAEGELKLELFAQHPEGGEGAVLLATRTVTVHVGEESHTSTFKLKTSGGDLADMVTGALTCGKCIA